MRALPLLGLLAALAGCAAAPPAPPESAGTPLPLPKVMSFGTTDVQAPQRANSDMARDFLDLSFNLESGQALKTFTRFEGPVTVAVTGIKSPALEKELRRLMKRLSSEAGIDIRRTADPEVRGQGIGRALIEAVYAAADEAGAADTYWMTQESNATARQLYDRIGQLTPFVKYSRGPKA